MKKFLPAFFFMLTYCAFSQQDTISGPSGFVGINSAYSYKMLEPNQDLRKVKILIDERQNGAIKNQSLIIGASLIALLDYQVSSVDSKFGYLMRHPTANNQIGNVVSEAVIHSFQLGVTGSVTNWLAMYAEILYDPEQSFGTGTITSIGRNQLQLRKGFILLGDLNKFPLYGAIGKMDAPFGQTGSVSPFTNSTMWHAFGGLGYGAQLGFSKGNLNASFMLVEGGAQFRVLHTTVGDSTNVPSRLNNFTADVNYTIDVTNDIDFLFGGSYMHGSAYCQNYPVTHFEPATDNNPAVTFYATLQLYRQIIIMGSYAQTIKEWPGTYNPNEPLNIYPASNVTAMDIGIKYEFNMDGKVNYACSGEYSNFHAGAVGAPWERQSQAILGFSAMLRKSSKFFIEVFRTDGYVPLNYISGGNLPPGETQSVRDAYSYGLVIGAQVTL